MISIVNYLFEISSGMVKNMTRTATFFNPETAKQYGTRLNPITSAAIDARRSRAESLRAGDLKGASRHKSVEKQLASSADNDYKQLPTMAPINYKTSTGERGVYRNNVAGRQHD
jgi:hypothetical protein